MVFVINGWLVHQVCVYVRRYGDKVFHRYPEGSPHEQQSVRITWFWIADYPEQYDWGGGYGTATLTLPGFQEQVGRLVASISTSFMCFCPTMYSRWAFVV